MHLGQLVQGSWRGTSSGLQGGCQRRRQVEQCQVMGHRRQVHAQALGDRRVRLAHVDASADEARQIQRCQPVALLVLGDLRIRVGAHLPHRDGHLLQAREACSAEPLGPELDAVAPVSIDRLHDDRLQDAVLADVLGQLLQLNLRELGTRVVRVFAERRQRNEKRLAGGQPRGFSDGHGWHLLRQRFGLGHRRLQRRLGERSWLLSGEQVELRRLGTVRGQAHAPIVRADS